MAAQRYPSRADDARKPSKNDCAAVRLRACHYAASHGESSVSGWLPPILHRNARSACSCHVSPARKHRSYRLTTDASRPQVRRLPLQPRGTSGKERCITRCEHEHLVDAMRDRLCGDPDPMTPRPSTVEHPFGTIKARMGTTHFRTRRLKSVRTEMALNVLACNIKRAIALIGIPVFPAMSNQAATTLMNASSDVAGNFGSQNELYGLHCRSYPWTRKHAEACL